MKPIKLTKQYKKNFRRRIASSPQLLQRFERRAGLFIANRRTPFLNDHALSGTMKGLRAFSVTGDIRVIYVEDPDCFWFVDIGTHAQVYRQIVSYACA